MLAVQDDDSGMRVERVLLDTAAREARMGDGPSSDPAERVGQRIGPWRLERLLGQGGMGEVWLASRADGEFEQLAAVKLVRPGWRAAQLVPRFRRERQLLARLQHPNIATLLDGGLTEGGFPYLAMEFVDGEPVTAWCAARNTSIRDRLVLFGTICEAVRFAHANLVVHRDLKPQNILVTKGGRPVLLDFGIATLIDPEFGEQFATREGDRVLTPEHAAPEQLRSEPATTATDVWALGILLYELLAGVRPFTGKDCTPMELERRVLHDDPPPPSAAARRKEDARSLRGDLDRIVMKALQKSPGRRYRSAEDFNEDIHRWLQGLPVRATPNSLGYSTRKFISRNRAALAVAALVGALVISFGAVSTWQARRIAKERDAAMFARGESEAVVAMLVDIFKVADPAATPGGDSLRVGDLLDRADKKLMESQEAPRIRTKLWQTLAEVHASRSRFDEQKRALEFAIESARQSGIEIDILAVQHELARFVWAHEGARAAEPLLRESLAKHEALLGPDADDVAIAAQDLAGVVGDKDEQSELLARSLSIRRKGFPGGTRDDSVGVASVLNALGSSHYGASRIAEAEAAFHESRAILEAIFPLDNPNVIALRSNEAMCVQSLGRYREAEAIQRELVDSKRRIFGDGSAWLAESLDNLGVCLASQGRHDEAVSVLREALAISEKTYGTGHSKTRWIANDLGIALVRGGYVEEGFKVFDRTRPSAWGDSDAFAGTDFAMRRARLELAAGKSVPLDSLRNWVARIRAAEPKRQDMFSTALQVYGTGLLAARSEANEGEAERAFAEAMTFSEGEANRMERAMARCGHELARAREGLSVDRAALTEAFETYGPWGMADPRIVSGVRSILEKGSESTAR